MANLLSRPSSPQPFPRLDPQQSARFEERLRTLDRALSAPGGFRQLEAALASFEAALEELDSGTSLITAHALLDEFDRARPGSLNALSGTEPTSDSVSYAAASSENVRTGELLCFWPGRSLSTGEAELASRGFFDVMDRPPLAYWLEAIARPASGMNQAFEVAILVWIPSSEAERARKGRRACGNGSLAWLGEVSPELLEQLEPIANRLLAE